MPTIKDQLNNANPNQLADLFRDFQLGDLIAQMPRILIRQKALAGAASNWNSSAYRIVQLPNDAKAAYVFRVTTYNDPVNQPTVVGELIAKDVPVIAPNTMYGGTPSSGQFGISPCGDVSMAGLQAGHFVDVVYLPMRGKVVEHFAVPSSGIVALPSNYVNAGVIYLLEAEVLEGAVTGNKIIAAPPPGDGGNASAGEVRLWPSKTAVAFNQATDAPTKVRFKILVGDGFDALNKLGTAAKF